MNGVPYNSMRAESTTENMSLHEYSCMELWKDVRHRRYRSQSDRDLEGELASS